MSSNLPERFSDDEVKAILARAIEIDVRDPHITADELREIAMEVGVSPSSIDAALRERVGAVPMEVPTPSRLRIVTISALGVPLGLAAGWVLSTGHSLGVLGLMGAGLLATGALVLFQSSTASLRTFHLKNLAFWGGVAAGGMLSSALADIGIGIGAPGLMAVVWGVRSWIASSILGSAAVIAVRRALRSRGSDSGAGTSSGSPVMVESRWRRLVRRVRTWILALNPAIPAYRTLR